MPLPQMAEYHAAVQNPSTAFDDAELKTSQPEKALFGAPRVWSGGFALTYHLSGRGDWAVRCFHREVPDRQRHYAELTAFLRKAPPSLFIPAAYLTQGIRVAGVWYPVIKMEWLKGEPLNSYIERSLGNLAALRGLPSAFRSAVASLQQIGAAHGDLQHGNILVVNGAVRLIDHDGMYVPGTAIRSTCEIGHANYQHPQRGQLSNGGFGPEMDRFSSIAIYLALLALAEQPQLWARYSNGENLLFRQADYVDPNGSRLFAQFEQMPPIQALVGAFRSICVNDISHVPTLEDFVSAPSRVRVTQQSRRPTIETVVRQYPVIAAADRQSLLAEAGNVVEVVGQVTSYHRDNLGRGRPYVLLNFGNYLEACFTLTIWPQALLLFDGGPFQPEDLKGKWVSVTGLIQQYKGKWGLVPQIDIDLPTRIEQLRDVEEANSRLRSRRSSAIAPASPSINQSIVPPVLPSPQTTPFGPVRAPPASPARSAPSMSSTEQRLFSDLWRNVPRGSAPSGGLQGPATPVQPSSNGPVQNPRITNTTKLPPNPSSTSQTPSPSIIPTTSVPSSGVPSLPTQSRSPITKRLVAFLKSVSRIS